MQLYYYRDAFGNLGDDLNMWFWPRAVPGLLDDDPGQILVGIGTLLDDRVPEGPEKVVFGSGAGYGRRPQLDDRWHVYCVRGPLTADALRLDRRVAITDPAMLATDFAATPQDSGAGPIFIPHHVTAARLELEGIELAEECAAAGVTLVDPRRPVEDCLSAIARADLVIAEAMHGAIVADAFRVPWKPVRLYEHVLDFKWHDWCSSVELDYEPVVMPLRSVHQPQPGEIARALKLVRSHPGRTSTEAAARNVKARLRSALRAVEDDFGSSSPSARPPTTAFGVFGAEVPTKQSNDDPWWFRLLRAKQAIARVVPDHSVIVLLDEGEWAAEEIYGRKVIAFPGGEAGYAGPPSDEAGALAAVEAALDGGAEYMVIASHAYWWLDHYPALRAYLSEQDELLKADVFTIFHFRQRP